MSEQDVVDVCRIGLCRGQLDRDVAEVGSQQWATAGVGQDVPAMGLHEERDHRGAPVPVGGQECLGQEPADLCGRPAVKVFGRDGPAHGWFWLSPGDALCSQRSADGGAELIQASDVGRAGLEPVTNGLTPRGSW